jgi:hypothetical protein
LDIGRRLLTARKHQRNHAALAEHASDARHQNKGGISELALSGNRPPETSLFDPAAGAVACYPACALDPSAAFPNEASAGAYNKSYEIVGNAMLLAEGIWRLGGWALGRGAARALPQIIKASTREMLGQATGHVKAFSGTAAQKADLFQQLGSQITKLSNGSWTAARGVGTEGSHVFLGGAGEALVINPAGQLFRGSLQTGGVSIAGVGRYAIDFAKLTGL